MSAVIQELIEEKTEVKKSKKSDLKVKMLSHAETKALQEEIRIKYKKAFDILKDKWLAELTIIPVEDIIDENYNLTGVKCDENRKKAVEGCYSSFYYYATPQEQITSIVVSLVKGHFFIDGNKRTALSTYIALSQANGLKFVEDPEKQADIFIQIASTHENISDYVKLLFR